MARTSATPRKNPFSKAVGNAAGKSKTAAVSKMTHSADPSPSGAKTAGTEADRHQMINVAAYYLAEQRGFAGGDPVADWLAAETRIDAMLKKSGVTRIH